jgi:pimeloyl-ACP methyl ester carboxylesterase
MEMAMAKPKRLVVIVPGLWGDPRKWEGLLSRLKKEPYLLADVQARWEFWPHRVTPFSFGPARSVARRLAAFINETFESNGPFEEVILVAHSMGGLFVREAYLLASNAYEPDGRPAANSWPTKVKKFVLFAAISRGFDPESRLRLRIGVAVFKLIRLYDRMTACDLTQGSAFVTNLRLAWVRYFRRLTIEGKDPVVVQLLGTIDTFVRREDCLDMEQFRKSETKDVSEARHDDVYRLETASNPDGRYAQIERVFRPDYQPDVQDVPLVSQQPRRIVFVLHGIRAGNTGWVNEAKSIIEKDYPDVLPIDAQYGYFSALHFFLPWVRRSQARWFQDRYSELAVKYPDPETKFYFIGHSNGTYMLGRGLAEVSMMRFERAYIAGSVLPSRYPWTIRVNAGQIGAIRSDGSAWDWPVGLLCSALSFMRDIGTGGFAGFEAAPPPPQFKEYRHYAGDHGKPLEDRRNLEEIVKYVLKGEGEAPKNLVKPTSWFRFASEALRYVGPVILIALIAGLAFWATGFTPLQWAIGILVLFIVAVFLMSM